MNKFVKVIVYFVIMMLAMTVFSRVASNAIVAKVYTTNSICKQMEQKNWDSKLVMYENCIPIEALHQQANGKFYVYIITERKVILGEQLFATRQWVEVLNKDLEYVAVEGIYSNYDVIIESTKNIEEGSRISRVQEQ